MVQVAVDQVVDVITVRHRIMPATRPVTVSALVARAWVAPRAPVGIVLTNVDRVFRHRSAFLMVQMPIVQVIDVIAVPDCGMAAPAAMPMVVVLVGMLHG
jgi:hypothetical protein